ncbi:hypothetical protein B0T21DRAFT_352921 [Apiosordaria backusii]|uniref:Zn(2)-C6 fungal-type domain-containing protein n=1 Tax=Apiosordaria backusii TaxID=314023 RepID=A0AA40A4C5_9PEZI|nr:hypothetical protein B0T21DRAFT_352921 [Apiosordaria backusii]
MYDQFQKLGPESERFDRSSVAHAALEDSSQDSVDSGLCPQDSAADRVTTVLAGHIQLCIIHRLPACHPWIRIDITLTTVITATIYLYLLIRYTTVTREDTSCGRCRKRKIRCSGDPGQGQPCSNCKNANAEPCQFLRVQSREAPFRSEPTGDTPFGYNVGDARLYASRAPTYASPSPHATGYAHSDLLSTTGHHLPVAGTDVLSSYRTSSHSGYSYTPAPKSYYPAPGPMPAYSSQPHGLSYAVGPDEASAFQTCGIPAPLAGSHPHDSVSLDIPVMSMPGATAWPTSRKSTSGGYGSMYLDPEVTSSPTTYATPSPSIYAAAVRGPSQHSHSATQGEGPSFSFTNMSASLPSSSQSDRVLPIPSTSHRSSTYPPLSGAKSSGPPTAATDHSSYDSYSSSRTESSGPESIFSDSDRAALSSQGPAFDSCLSPYGHSGSTDASGRRDSAYGAGPESGGHDGPSLPSLSSAYGHHSTVSAERHHAAVATRH